MSGDESGWHLIIGKTTWGKQSANEHGTSWSSDNKMKCVVSHLNYIKKKTITEYAEI